MKRLACSIVILCAAAALFAQEAKNNWAVVFPGTGTTLGTLDTGKASFEAALAETHKLRKDYTRPILIGHSQGGMRALNYANYLALEYPSDKSKQAEGVISVAGPLTGFTPLAGGKAVFITRFSTVTSDLENGVFAALYGGGSLLSNPMLSGITTPITASFAHGWAVDNLGGLIAPAFDDPNFHFDVNAIMRMALTRQIPDDTHEAFTVSDAVIRDFTPGSAYLKKYSLPTEVDSEAHSYVVENGSHLTYVWSYVKILGINIGYWELITVKDHKIVFVPATYKPNPLLDSNTRIAYLRGTNSDMATFSKECEEEHGDKAETNYADLAGYLDGASVVMDVAGGVDAAIAAAATASAVICYATLNIPCGIILTAVAVEATAYSAQAFTASKLCGDRNYTVNKRIYNTTASDGLVTLDSTTLPKSYTGGRGWAGPDPEVIKHTYTHQRMYYDDKIWGDDGEISNINERGDVDDLIRAYDKNVANAITAGNKLGNQVNFE